jgi:hypothetical protein
MCSLRSSARTRSFIVAVIAVTAALCAAPAALGDGLHDALRLWIQFPVDAKPRAIIATNTVVLPDAVSVWLAEHRSSSAGVFRVTAKLPGRARAHDGYPVVSAATAYASLRSAAREAPSPPQTVIGIGPDPLRIRAVRLGTGSFATDRGQTRLPAWQFFFAGFAAPGTVLAVKRTFPALHFREDTGWIGGSQHTTATISPSGTQVAITFFGAPAGSGPCDQSYTVDVADSHTAVAFTISAAQPQPTTSVPCATNLTRRTIVATLARPLGARVLVSGADGNVIPVTRPKR